MGLSYYKQQVKNAFQLMDAAYHEALVQLGEEKQAGRRRRTPP